MSDQSLFSLDRFLSLSGPDLFQYAEPFVSTETALVPESVYDPLRSMLTEMDDRHLVYALEICMLLKPQEFASRAADFLSHVDSAVCCAACRALEHLDADAMTPELVKRITETPIVDLFSVHVRTGERVRVGSNKEFIRHLLAVHNR
jgi:hypothetical protein